MVRLGLGVSGDLPLGTALDNTLDGGRISGGRQLAPGSRGDARQDSSFRKAHSVRFCC
jgi:hypothetical protein